MRLLTKPEACRKLRVSLSTLNRRIAAGDVPVRREPRGRRHRVYVMVNDDPPGSSKVDDSALAVAQERIRGLVEQVELLQGQLEREQRRNAELLDNLKGRKSQVARRELRGFRWRLWNRKRQE